MNKYIHISCVVWRGPLHTQMQTRSIKNVRSCADTKHHEVYTKSYVRTTLLLVCCCVLRKILLKNSKSSTVLHNYNSAADISTFAVRERLYGCLRVYVYVHVCVCCQLMFCFVARMSKRAKIK